MKINKLFDKPKVIAVVGDVHQAKSNLLYHLINSLKSYGNFNLYTYGLRNNINGATEIYSVKELEEIKNSIIILDEVMSLWDLDNRKIKKEIEKTLRLINHNNNILVICGLPENFKKFISGKINEWFFKKCTLVDFINGSNASNVCKEYRGIELGSRTLSLHKHESIYYNGVHYEKINVPYLKKYDSKKDNVKIVQKIVHKNKLKKTKLDGGK